MLAAIGEPGARYASALDEQALDARIERHRAARALDHRHQRLGEHSGATHRIAAAAEEMAHDLRVHREASAAWRAAMIGPLRGEHSAQLRVADRLAQHLVDAARHPAPDETAHPPAVRGRQRSRQRTRAKDRHCRALRAVQGAEKVVDLAFRSGKALLEAAARGLLRAGKGELEAIREMHRIESGPGRRDLDAAFRDPDEQLYALRAHVAEVMQAYVPGVACARESLRQAAGCEVLLEHQHLAAALGERSGAGEPADARADDDRVPARRAHAKSPFTAATIFPGCGSAASSRCRA